MNLYKITLIFAELLSVILGSIWIVYKLREMQVDDLIMNTATYSLMIYVALGNLIEQLTKN
ncbi:MAG: hypothetical protein A2729_03635 [Candidatus Buchananbacteria bacterium RIFCSPHIGHO2_01_FULL_39_14]|uniref:Uncharacterized protein n=1 Tax=Candidatus Buchananbacteria bacterium RIFCSPHIGHO2_01_FULL_39_14 TaxID=1797532 RepID=A0A1G1XU37_9BACT|nr:MAG: hypothetical protein A2729_03635 [Candidatus Buchananbacteria bacterium RIFCSPHIGHO2_01_FULL_39_14]